MQSNDLRSQMNPFSTLSTASIPNNSQLIQNNRKTNCRVNNAQKSGPFDFGK